MQRIINEGVDRPDRTGTGTRALFGQQMRFNLNEGFPAITTKKLAWKACVSELLWFIEGSGDERRLREILHGDRNSEKTTIWTDNAEAGYWKHKAKYQGDLGRVYGVQWRHWQGVRGEEWVCDWNSGTDYKVTKVDQLAQLVHGLTTDPYGRRHILTAWNPGELDQMALPPCHMFSQFFVAPMTEQDAMESYQAIRSRATDEEREQLDYRFNGRMPFLNRVQELGLKTNKLSCQMYQRSCDMFLGVPFNIASYSLFTHMLAQSIGFGVGEFVWVGGDCHIYNDHFDAVKEQLGREEFMLPELKLNPNINNIEKFTMNDIELVGYKSHGAIKAKMAV